MTRWTLLFILICLAIPLHTNADQFSETRSNRQKAVTTCNDYREKNRLPCFVSRNRCPRGFEIIKRFNNNRGAEFVACRDLRHERPAHFSQSNTFNQDKRALLEQFNRLTTLALDAEIGTASHLPQSTLHKLSVFFSQINLEKIAIHRSKAISNGCFNDCQRIFCSPEEPIEHWIKPVSQQIPSALVLQVAYAEHCEIQGGRERYIMHGLRSLPEGALSRLKQGTDFDASEIGYAGYIESHAKNRVESVCRRISCSKQ